MNEYGWSQMSNIIFARTNPEHIGNEVKTFFDNFFKEFVF